MHPRDAEEERTPSIYCMLTRCTRETPQKSAHHPSTACLTAYSVGRHAVVFDQHHEVLSHEWDRACEYTTIERQQVCSARHNLHIAWATLAMGEAWQVLVSLNAGERKRPTPVPHVSVGESGLREGWCVFVQGGHDTKNAPAQWWMRVPIPFRYAATE